MLTKKGREVEKEHALGGPNHYIRFDKPQILATEQRFIPRMIREAIEIKKYPNFNREDGTLERWNIRDFCLVQRPSGQVTPTLGFFYKNKNDHGCRIIIFAIRPHLTLRMTKLLTAPNISG
ncbi:hypothetical protein evm_011984 [Chilo suppressalis]|nr:hypothetical protein evm_011984 [Chilo suppressalis]